MQCHPEAQSTTISVRVVHICVHACQSWILNVFRRKRTGNVQYFRFLRRLCVYRVKSLTRMKKCHNLIFLSLSLSLTIVSTERLACLFKKQWMY